MATKTCSRKHASTKGKSGRSKRYPSKKQSPRKNSSKKQSQPKVGSSVAADQGTAETVGRIEVPERAEDEPIGRIQLPSVVERKRSDAALDEELDQLGQEISQLLTKAEADLAALVEPRVRP